MRTGILWTTLVAFTLAACTPGRRGVPVSSDDAASPQELESILRSLRPGDPIDVWTAKGECFEARFDEYAAGELRVTDKWYGRGHHRGEGLRGDRLAYPLSDLVRIDPDVEARNVRAADVVLTLFAAAAIMLGILAAAFSGGLGFP